MTKKQRALKAIEILEGTYTQDLCSLEYERPREMLFAVRLAAQCTDERVNRVTPELYSRYPTLEALANAQQQDVEEIVHSCGFFRQKARDIILASQMLIRDYGGVLPDSIDELTKLPGVGRKTANLIVGDVYKKPAVVCDTHCIRITNLLGLTQGKDPYKVEMQLWDILPAAKANDFCHRLVLFGRETCIARRPQCRRCPLQDCCKYYVDSSKAATKAESAKKPSQKAAQKNPKT